MALCCARSQNFFGSGFAIWHCFARQNAFFGIAALAMCDTKNADFEM